MRAKPPAASKTSRRTRMAAPIAKVMPKAAAASGTASISGRILFEGTAPAAEKVKLSVRVPAQYAGQSLGALKGFGEILKEEWGQDGGLSVVLEVPAASQPNLFERLGAVTKGSAQVTLVK